MGYVTYQASDDVYVIRQGRVRRYRLSAHLHTSPRAREGFESARPADTCVLQVARSQACVITQVPQHVVSAPVPYHNIWGLDTLVPRCTVTSVPVAQGWTLEERSTCPTTRRVSARRPARTSRTCSRPARLSTPSYGTSPARA